MSGGKPRFSIGDRVWLASFDSSDAYVTCPDCGGTGRLRVTFHNETTVSIECANCAAGYSSPTGRIKIYDRQPRAWEITVTGIEMTGIEVTYRLGGDASSWRSAADGDVFATHDEAWMRARAVAEEAAEDERKRVYRKERDTRTWAWNASYHRGEIKRALKSVEYHTSKLTVAALKAKEDKGSRAEGKPSASGEVG